MSNPQKSSLPASFNSNLSIRGQIESEVMTKYLENLAMQEEIHSFLTCGSKYQYVCSSTTTRKFGSLSKQLSLQSAYEKVRC